MEVKKTFDRVVSEMNKLRCPQHNESANLVITGNNANPNIDIKNICCESFKKKIIKTTKDKLQLYFIKEAQKDINDIFK